MTKRLSADLSRASSVWDYIPSNNQSPTSHPTASTILSNSKSNTPLNPCKSIQNHRILVYLINWGGVRGGRLRRPLVGNSLPTRCQLVASSSATRCQLVGNSSSNTLPLNPRKSNENHRIIEFRNFVSHDTFKNTRVFTFRIDMGWVLISGHVELCSRKCAH